MIRPKVKEVSVYDDYCLFITFSNDEQRIFDMRPYLEFEQYKELKNKNIFAKVKPTLTSVEWSTGQSIDPHELYYASSSYFI